MTVVDLTCETDGCHNEGSVAVPDQTGVEWWLCLRCAEEAAYPWAPPPPRLTWPWRLVALAGLILGLLLAFDGFRWIFTSVELDANLIWLHWLEGCCGAGAALIGFLFLFDRTPQ